jgi:hypothetical protein
MAYTTIDNPELYFQTKTYTGTEDELAITLDGDENMQPDFVWIKRRATSQNHFIFDSVRGATKYINSNTTDPEFTQAQGLKSFDTDGFTLGTWDGPNDDVTNVAWCWKAGGSASANSDGGTSSSVSANTTAGFSIVSWTGSSSASVQTIGHGLGTTPHWILSKNRGSGSSITAWINYHHKIDASAPEDYTIYLNNTDARVDNAVHGDTKPTSTVFSFNTGTDDQNYISYCFTEKKGFSKFGSYTGNGNNDGTFVYTGFAPAYVMIKKSNASGTSWVIFDNKRNTFNERSRILQANDNGAEETSTNRIDFTSNGFKLRGTWTVINNSGDTYIYMAFAESPFVNSNGVPNNSR